MLPVADIGRLTAVAPDHVALWVETFGGVQPEARDTRDDGQDVLSFARFGEAVLITPMVDAICDCLVPVAPDVDPGGGGWEVWLPRRSCCQARSFTGGLQTRPGAWP